MSEVVTRVAPLIDRAAPSLMPALDLDHSRSGGATFWELWDVRLPNAPRVARYMTLPNGAFAGWSVGDGVEIEGSQDLEEFLQRLREIEAR